MKIKLSTTLRWPIERQIPRRWAELGIEVLINQPVERCDAWVVYNGLYRPDRTVCPPEQLIFFTYEPPGLHDYQSGFLDQFATVVTSHPNMRHANVLHRHQAQPWFAGVRRVMTTNVHVFETHAMPIEELAAIEWPEKTKALSTICSTKVMIAGHSARLQFLEQLRRTLGDRFDVYGFGIRPIDEKLDALLPYDFHLVLENYVLNDYWTEKLADAYLGYCFPIVWGCPNLEKYFPAESFARLDADNETRAIEQVKAVLAEGMTPRRRAAVLEARRRLLEEFNLFEEIVRIIAARPSGAARMVRLRDENLFHRHGWLKPAARLVLDRIRRDRFGKYGPLA